MKQILVLFVILLAPIAARAEVIHSFTSDIALSKDGSFGVTETIVYDFENEARHGIFRFIPTDHWQKSERFLYNRFLQIDVVGVSQDGNPVPYDISRDLGKMEVKIGDPDRTITGSHTYTINYTVQGGLTYYDDQTADLYWNVTGNEWEIPIEAVTVRLADPENLYEDNSACYRGSAGQSISCEMTVDNGIYTFTADNLASGEGVTIAQRVNAEKVDRQVLERLSVVPIWLVVAALWLLGLLVYVIRERTKYRTGRTIVAEYEPLPEIKPMYTGLLFDGSIDPRDITAGIVALAERGFFKITRIERRALFFFKNEDYEVTLLRPTSEAVGEFERSLISFLFKDDAAVGSTVSLDALAADKSKQVENQKILEKLKTTANADLINNGYFEKDTTKTIYPLLYLLLGLAALLGLTRLVGANLVIPLVIAAVTLVLSIILAFFAYRRRTRKGYEALDHLHGFKLFLSVTEKDRFKFHNSPKLSPEQFMEFLPYAIAFGVEKEWAEVFKDISIPQPDWYEGRGAAFSAVHLSNSLGSFNTAVAHASAPASSGGGASGGGSGGGGGGSW